MVAQRNIRRYAYPPELTLQLVNELVTNNDNASALATMTDPQLNIVNALIDRVVVYEVKIILIVIGIFIWLIMNYPRT